MSKLEIRSSKDRDFAELVKIVEAVETCTFKDFSEIRTEREEIITVAPPRNPRLKKPNMKLLGWIKGRKAQGVFEGQLEKYQHNQYCYLQRLESGKTSASQTKNDLTELEMWFIQIIEPPPEKPKKVKSKSNKSKSDKSKNDKYQDYLERWLKREKVKYQFSRSYYCDDEVVKHLDKERINSIQSTIFQYYDEVKRYYELESSA